MILGRIFVSFLAIHINGEAIIIIIIILLFNAGDYS